MPGFTPMKTQMMFGARESVRRLVRLAYLLGGAYPEDGRFFLDGEGDPVASGAEALRFMEAVAGELVVEAFGAVAFCLSGDGFAGDDSSKGFMEGTVRVLLRLGESADVLSYEYCCNAAPKLGEDPLSEVVLCNPLVIET